MTTKKRFLSMLVLLAAAVTGAWAQTTYNVTFSANGNTKTKENVTLPYQFKCDNWSENGELDEIIQELYELSSGGFCNGNLSASGSSQVSVGTDGNDDYITINGPIDGTATVTGTYYDNETDNFDYSIQITTTEYTPPSYLYLEFAGTSTTLKYGPVPASTGYYDPYYGHWEENGYVNGDADFWDTYWACTTLSVDASCQNFTGSCLSALLAYMSDLTTINNISNLNTANVTDMSQMFDGCSSLETLDLSGWNTANVTNTNYMFDGCTKLNKSVTANEGATGEYWATYYNSALGYTADANTTVYQAKVNGTTTGVVLTEVTSKEIPAGQGVVLKSSSSTITLTPATTTVTYSDNQLLGTDAALATPANAYCLSKETSGSSPRGVGFYTYTLATIPAHKAYLVVAGGPSSARGFLGFGDNYTTDIDLPEAVVIEGDGPIYDLSGRLVTGQPQKGIYVKNGKKVVIK